MCSFHKPQWIGYWDWHAWAEKQKVKQIFCTECKLWFFPSEFGTPEETKDRT